MQRNTPPDQLALCIALTGGIGCGKTTVANIFKSLDIPVIDFDEISRSLTQGTQSCVLDRIRAQFGDAVFQPDGSLSRSLLRDLVFNSPVQKKQLEDILHPLIFEQALQQYQCLKNQSAFIVFDIPLLIQGVNLGIKWDKVLVIDCDEETQISRVMQRSAWTHQQVLSVIHSQALRSERLAAATDIIFNQGADLESLRLEVINLLKKWQQAKDFL